MNRYTSPGLSKQLAEAGVCQPRLTPAWRIYDATPAHAASVTFFGAGVDIWESYQYPYFRALDLTDVIEELTKEQDGGALADIVDLSAASDASAFVSARKRDTAKGRAHAAHPDIVEAAGRVLLALLKERARSTEAPEMEKGTR